MEWLDSILYTLDSFSAWLGAIIFTVECSLNIQSAKEEGIF